MIQCQDCEFYRRGPDGAPRLMCDPFKNIKEPECLAKWQLIKLNVIVQAHERTLAMYAKLAPLQERMFRHLEREIDDVDEADRWKYHDEDEDDDDDPLGV